MNDIVLTLRVDNISRACICDFTWSSQPYCEVCSHPHSEMWKGVLRKDNHLPRANSWLEQSLGYSKGFPDSEPGVFATLLMHLTDFVSHDYPSTLITGIGRPLRELFLRFRQLLKLARIVLELHPDPGQAFCMHQGLCHNKGCAREWGYWGDHPNVATNRPRFHCPAGCPNGQASEAPVSIPGIYSSRIQKVGDLKSSEELPIFHPAHSLYRWEDQGPEKGREFVQPKSSYLPPLLYYSVFPNAQTVSPNHFKSFFRVCLKILMQRNTTCNCVCWCLYEAAAWCLCMDLKVSEEGPRGSAPRPLILQMDWLKLTCLVTCSGQIANVSYGRGLCRFLMPGAHNLKSSEGRAHPTGTGSVLWWLCSPGKQGG